MSLHGPMARGSPAVSSGATKPGVPTTVPVKVATPAGRATPKSASLKIVVAEAAAEHVVGLEIAVDDAHVVHGREAAREALHRVRRARGVEGRPRHLEAVIHALRERGALGPAVHVLDHDPGHGDMLAPVGDGIGARIDVAHDERRRRHALVEATERDRLLLDDERRRRASLGRERRFEHLDDDRHLALRGDAEGVKDHAHAALAELEISRYDTPGAASEGISLPSNGSNGLSGGGLEEGIDGRTIAAQPGVCWADVGEISRS